MIKAINYRVCRVVDNVEEDLTKRITTVTELVQNIPDSMAKPYTFRAGTTTLEGHWDINPQIGDVIRIYIDGNKMFEGIIPRHTIIHHSNHKVEFDVWSYSYAMKKADASYSDFCVKDLYTYVHTKLFPTGYTQTIDFDNYMNVNETIQSWIPPEMYKDWGDIGAIYVLSGNPQSGSMTYAVGVGKHLLVYEWSDYGATNTLLLDYATGEILNEAIYDDIIKTNIGGTDYLIALLTMNYKHSNGETERVLYEVVKVKISDWSVTYSYPHPHDNDPLYFQLWGIREGNTKMWTGANTSDGKERRGWYNLDTMPSLSNESTTSEYSKMIAISDNPESDQYYYVIDYSQTLGLYVLNKINVLSSPPYTSLNATCISDLQIVGNRLFFNSFGDDYICFRSTWHHADSKFENGQIVAIKESDYSVAQKTFSGGIAGLSHFIGDGYCPVFVQNKKTMQWDIIKFYPSSGLESSAICENINLTIPDRNRVWVLSGSPIPYIVLYQDTDVIGLNAISKYVIKTVYGKMEYSCRKAYEELAKAWNCIFFIDHDKRIYFVDAKKWISQNRTTHQLLHHIKCDHSTIYDYDYVKFNGVTVGQIGITREFMEITAECLNHLPHLFHDEAQEAYDVYGKPWDYWKIPIEHGGVGYKIEDYLEFAEGEGIIKGIVVYNDRIELEVINEQGD